MHKYTIVLINNKHKQLLNSNNRNIQDHGERIQNYATENGSDLILLPHSLLCLEANLDNELPKNYFQTIQNFALQENYFDISMRLVTGCQERKKQRPNQKETPMGSIITLLSDASKSKRLKIRVSCFRVNNAATLKKRFYSTKFTLELLKRL